MIHRASLIKTLDSPETPAQLAPKQNVTSAPVACIELIRKKSSLQRSYTVNFRWTFVKLTDLCSKTRSALPTRLFHVFNRCTPGMWYADSGKCRRTRNTIAAPQRWNNARKEYRVFPIRRLNGHIVFKFSHKYCKTSNTIWHSFNYQTYHLEGERKSRNVLPTCAYASYTKIHLGIQICGCAEPSRIHIVRDVFQSVSLRTTKLLAIRYTL